MITGLETPPDPAAAGLIHPATGNPAVALCCKAYARAYREAAAAGKDHVLAKFAACAAYRNAMPPLDGVEHIRGFIACAAHAMLIGALETSDGAKLLYAAQVASTFLPKPSSPDVQRRRKPAEKPGTEPRKLLSSTPGSPAQSPYCPSPAGREAV